jgi:hypothetical protein
MRPTSRLAVVELEAREVPAAPFDTLPVIPTSDPGVLDHARAIIASGAALGRRTDVFMKVGDSNSDPGFGAGYLYPFGSPTFNPVASGLAAAYPTLLDTLAVYRTPAAGTGVNSFSRVSSAVVAGATVGTVWPRLSAEANATGAGIALVMIGTNDVAAGPGPEAFRAALGSLVRTLIASGVVPILSTIPDNVSFRGQFHAVVPAYNQVIADVAAEQRVPLWNLWRAFTVLPTRGLDSQGLHLSASPNPGGVTPNDLLFGQNFRGLQALQVLDWFREQVVGVGSEPVPPFPTWTSLGPGADMYAAGRGPGQWPVVSIYDRATGQELDRFLAYEPSFTGGVQVAMADVNGDRVPDIVTAPGSGGGPVVKVFSGTDGTLIGSVLAFEPSFRTGVNVAATDLDGDGKAEVIVGAGNGGGPAVAVFHGGDLKEVQRFFAFESSFRGGVNVAAANLTGFGPSIVVGSGVGGGPVVKVFRFGEQSPAASFFVYDPSVRTGVNVAAGDWTGDGFGEIAMAPGSGSSHVRIIDPGKGSDVGSFFAGDPVTPGGVRLAVVNGRLLVGNGPGSGVAVRAYSGLSTTPEFLPPNDPARAFGIDVG